MKTISSLMQAVVYLIPADLALPVMSILNVILPLLAIIAARFILYATIFSQKLRHSMSQKIRQAKLVRSEDMHWIGYDRYKKMRA